MPAPELLPWHASVWTGLRAQLQAEALPHALLVTGLPGVGKRRLSFMLGTALLCESRRQDGLGCGDCRSCRQLGQGVHPDFFLVAPEEEGKQIKVDQVRRLIDRLSLKSQYGGYRIGLIDPADRMNAAAANALLKTLEEPPAGIVLLLTAARPSALPATVRSRCRRLELAPPPPSVAAEWLRAQAAPGAEDVLGLAAGAPLRALDLHAARAQDRLRALLATLERLQAGRTSPVTAAAEWRESGRELIPLLLSVCSSLARLQVGGDARIGESDRLRQLAAALDLSVLHDYVGRLTELRRHLDHPLNEQLLLESAFAGWQAATKDTGPLDTRP